MKTKIKRRLAALLAFIVLATSITPFSLVEAEASTELVNVAPNGTATTVDGENGDYVITNVNDGNDATSWQTPGTWPATAILQLDMGRTISKVVVKLGGDESSSRSVNVTVEYAQNGVTSDLITLGTQTVTLSGDMEAVFTPDTAFSATHFYVTLSDPLDGGSTGTFYPDVAEIEVYESQEVSLSNYNNIANQAAITVTGNNEHSSEGSANLVDGSDSTLYKFYNAAMSSEQTITLTFSEARAMDAFRIAFENVGSSDSNSFSFVYSILAGTGDGTYDTIVEKATANRTDNSSQQYKIAEKTYSVVQIVMHSCMAGSNYGWPAIAEFEIYGSENEVDDSGSIAWKKDVHVSSGDSLAKNITDGNVNSVWRGSYYPAYVDIYLEKNYIIDTVEVFTPENGYSQYSIYTSKDGRDFTKLAKKSTTDVCDLTVGEVYEAPENTEAQIVRVYLEYNSAETAAVINEVRVTGTENGEAQTIPAVSVSDYATWAAANDVEITDDGITITDKDTYDEVYGIIERRLGKEYKNWFTLELAKNPNNNDYDYYELSIVDGKVHVKGNDGVSLATGINYYLKYHCKVNLSQVGDQADMPDEMPTFTGTIHRETKAEVRYSYNYCTLSYSMAFWGEDEWRDELDWLALNGVNVVLDATGQEEVWRRFLGELGYSHADIKDFIAGPAYYAWAYMANLSGFGGPVHDSWFEERTELARQNQLIMRKLGMQPVLQGYSGMVPTDIQDYDSSAQIISQGTWCSFQRPAMLVTTSDTFDKYAALFYKCQKEVYGDVTDYYATDPFHEGGNTGGMSSTDIAEEVLTSMLAADSDCVWIIQAWQGNPTTALLNGLDEVTDGAAHALILDLYAEKTPHYAETGSSYGDTDEFDDTPWVFCMLNNFGGRLGLHGHLDNLAEDIPYAMNNCDYIKGIGITPEASVNNPVLYDFIFETIWQEDAKEDLDKIVLDDWLKDYAERRYGASSDSANAAWKILQNTVYKSDLNNLGQGAPESVVNARPALSISAASTWGNAVVSYDKLDLEEAASLLLEDYDTLQSSEGYLYDLATVLEQVLSNSAQYYQQKMAAAYSAGDLDSFTTYSTTFLQIIDYMEQVTSTSEYYLLGRWVKQAQALAENADDFAYDLYTINAKALVTTWGSYNQAESGGLKDYSNRQWSGLISDFYKVRWERWITARINELSGNDYESSINWFEWEWSWVRGNTDYKNTPTTLALDDLGEEILEKFTVLDEASDSSKDVDPSKMEVYAENYYPGESATEGNPAYAIDGDSSTWWHTVWSDSDRSTHYLILTFDEVTTIDGMRFLQRTGTNGVVTKYSLYVRESETDDWTEVIVEGELATTTDWQKVSFDAVSAKQVKFQVVEANSDSSNKYAAVAEIRFTEVQSDEEEEVTPTPTPTPTETPTPTPTPEPEEDKLSDYKNIADKATVTTNGEENLDPTYGGPPANLTDKDDNTLYKFHKNQLTEEKEIVLTYDELVLMDAVSIAFENVGDTDQYNYTFTYSILAKKADGTYDTIVENATANRTDNSSQSYSFDEAEYSEIKIVMHSCTTGSDNSGIGWPAVAEFEIYGLSAYPNIADESTVTTTGTEHPSEGSENLVDEDSDTLYKFHNAAMSEPKDIILTYDVARNVDAVRILFENVGETDSLNYQFTYNILARNGEDGEWVVIAENVTANRTDNSVQSYQFDEAVYTEFKIEMLSCTTGSDNSGTGWPAIAEFEIYGNTLYYVDDALYIQQKTIADLLSDADQSYRDTYTEESMKVLDDALATVNAWLETGVYSAAGYLTEAEAEAAQPEVDAMAELLTQALNGLQKKTKDIALAVGETRIFAVSSDLNMDDLKNYDEDNGIAEISIEDGELKITGLSAGTIYVTIDDVEYTITVAPSVADSAITANTGKGTSSVITKLTISEDNSFDLDVNVENAESVTWTSGDESLLTIDEDGVITFTDENKEKITEVVTTSVTATVVTASGTETYTIPVVIYPESDAANKKLFDLYITEISNTDVYYSWNCSTDLTHACEGEAIYVSFDAAADVALDFMGAPDDGYALTYMSSTDSLGHYMTIHIGDDKTLDTSENGFLNYPNGAGDIQSGDGLFGEDAVMSMLYEGIDRGCDGAMGFTRPGNDTSGVASALTFRSAKLPEVEKSVMGIMGASGLRVDYRPYEAGMSASENEYVYFEINVITYRPLTLEEDGTSVVDYSNIILTDTALSYLDENGEWQGASFIIDKGKDTTVEKDDIIPSPADVTKDISADIMGEVWADGEEYKEHKYYVAYKITADDLDTVLENDVELAYHYHAVYSTGEYDDVATANAEITVSNFTPKDLVVDFGLPVEVTYNPWGQVKIETADAEAAEYQSVQLLTGEDVGTASYGTVDVSKVADGDDYYWKITYTPTTVLKDVDLVTVYGDGNGNGQYDVGYTFSVYPANSVYYEESFMDIAADWSTKTLLTTVQQDAQFGNTAKTTGAAYNYGYDAAYIGEDVVNTEIVHEITVYDENGNKTDANGVSVSNDGVGTFTFTGTGIDIYANCTENTGAAMILIRNSAGMLKRFFTVDTKLNPGTVDSAGLENVSKTLNVPIVSLPEGSLQYNTYTVTIAHIPTKIIETEKVTDPDTGEEKETELKTVTYNPTSLILDGFRVYGTLKGGSAVDKAETYYAQDNESNSYYVELRDSVLYGMDINIGTDNTEDYKDQLADGMSQIYASNGTKVTGAVLVKTTEESGTENIVYTGTDLTDFMDNSSKNELYLYPGQSLIFNVTSDAVNPQIAMKSLVSGSEVEYTISSLTTVTDEETQTATTTATVLAENVSLKANTEMYYPLQMTTVETDEETSVQDTTFMISNTGTGILALTKLKISNPYAAATTGLGLLSEADLSAALYSLNPGQEESGNNSGNDNTTDVVVNPFEDVAEGAYYYDAVLWAINNEITEGTSETTFSPDATCTRSQVVTFLWRAAGSPAAEGENPFTDVADDAYYYDAVLWAVENEITEGTEEGKFSPDGIVTRDHVVTFLWRAAGKPAHTIENPFTDVAEEAYYYDAVLWAYENEITDGAEDNLFAPTAECTRGQVVTFLYRAEN